MMPKKKREAAGGVNNIKRRVVILIAVAAMAVCSLVVVRGVLLANAKKMGNEIAHSYSVENTRNLIGYETMLRLCTGYIDQQLKNSSDPETWIQIFMQSLVEIVGEDEIDPYAVIGGKIVAADPREVYGDSFRVTQILSNLLSNAVKFTSEGDTISLKVSERQNSDFVKYKLVLKDTGAGMSRDFLDRIFIPYEREVRFGAKNVSGTELGMPIVKNILSQMNGEISVESELGKGSIFTVILPFRKADVEEDTEDNPVSGETEEDFLRNRKILLAEDNEINMEIACELLDMYGAQVVKAWNGKEAVDLFADSGESEFDVILMDMQMPEMDGCEAARTIRRMKRRDSATIPIIAVTANAFAEDLSATAAAGMNAHISKPIDFSLLCRTLKEVMDRQGNA